MIRNLCLCEAPLPSIGSVYPRNNCLQTMCEGGGIANATVVEAL
jgi:hypothetical protein